MGMASYYRLGSLSLIWGSVFLWIKISGYGFSAVQMVLIRLVLGAVVILAIAKVRKVRFPRDRATWFHISVAALLGNAIPWTLYAQGEQTGASSVAAVVNGTAPIWTLAATLVLARGGRVSLYQAGGVLLGLLGTLLVVAPWNSGEGLGGTSSIICFVLGSVSFGTSFAYMGRFLAPRKVAPVAMAGGQLSIAALFLLIATPFLGLQPIQWRTDSVLSLVVLGVLCTGIAALLNFEIIVRDGVAVASSVAYLMTVVAVLLGAFVLTEDLPWTVWLGTVAVLGATWCLRRKPKAAVAAAVPAPAPSAPAVPTAATPIATAPAADKARV